MKKLVVFTDLDGTLLDHENYEFTVALDAIKALEKKQIPLYFISSKTSSEIQSLQQSLNLNYSYSSENGAVIHLKNHKKSERIFTGKDYTEIIQALNEIRKEYKFNWTGFSDMSVKEISEHTGLSIDDATYASLREASEPLLWQDSEAALIEFKEQLRKYELCLTRGGRFYHVMSSTNKAAAVKQILDSLIAQEPATEWLSVALGDSLNDVPMLEAVDIPILVNNPHGSRPDISHINNISITSEPAPRGWYLSITDIIKKHTGI